MNHPKFLPLILLLILEVPVCFCQDDPLYETCRDQSFRCGTTTVGYPFWGGDRPDSCGHPGFKLNCKDENIAQVEIESVTYRVLEINSSTRTVKLSREDLWSELCPRYLYNTSFTSNLFKLYSFNKVGLYYGCSQLQFPPSPFPNQFECSVNETTSLSFFQYPLESSGPHPGIVCTHRIVMYVNQTAALSMTMDATALKEALQYGFLIQWEADDENCTRCKQSGGGCGYNTDSDKFACHCFNGTSNSTCANRGNSKSRIGMNIGLSIAGVVIAGFGLAFSLVFCRRRWKQRNIRRNRLHNLDKKHRRNVNTFQLHTGSLAPKRYTYEEIKRITKSLSEMLGQGGYGKVYKGWLPEGQIVAVKVLTGTNDSGEEFINEVASISRTSHVNIVNLLGFCQDRKRRALVYEFMSNKSLDRFIHKSGQSNLEHHQLEWEKLYDIAIGVARGLEYLHRGCNTKIVHFDIKPQNILLDKDFSPKISDFGLAKLFKREQSVISMFGMRGTIGYIAPEVFSRTFGAISHKSDVYSYGMVLLEMSGARKFDEIEETKSSENYFFDKIYEHVVHRNINLEAHVVEENEESARKMLLVGLWCIQIAPSDRPSMSKVVEMLEGSIESIQIPPKPFLSSPKLSALQLSSTFSV